MKKNLVLAITTYQRKDFLKETITTWLSNRSEAFNWKIIICDDGSTDGTIDFITSFSEQHNIRIQILKSNRKGVHHNTNRIIDFIKDLNFDLCFKIDDDIIFKKKGWEQLYVNAISETNFEHLVFYDKKWNKSNNRKNDIIEGKLISKCESLNIQGAFFTITPKIISKVGYFDCLNFGFKGLGHIDYSFRCSRAGFNSLGNIFDANKSENYIKLNNNNYYPALPNTRNQNEAIKIDVILAKKRIHIPYNENKLNQMQNNEQRFLVKNDRKWKFASEQLFGESFSNRMGLKLKKIYNKSLKNDSILIPTLFKDYLKYLPIIGRHFRDIDI